MSKQKEQIFYSNKFHHRLMPRVFFLLFLITLTAISLSKMEQLLARPIGDFTATPPPHWISDTITRGVWGINDMVAFSAASANPTVLGITSDDQPAGFSAQLINQSRAELILKPGKSITVWAEFRNTGSKGWRYKTGPFVALNATAPAGRVSAFRNKSWDKKTYRVLKLSKPVGVGKTVRLRFILHAPLAEGTYTEKFGLVAENQAWIPGGEVSFAITVGTPKHSAQPIVNAPLTTAAGEPIIRVGLTQTQKPVVVQSTTPFQVNAGTTSLFASTLGPVTATVANGAATVTDGATTLTTDQPVRFSPTTAAGIMEIVSFENRPGWNTALNDNAFRGTIEVHAPVGQASAPLSAAGAWVINELPMEQYLRGLAEVTNAQPTEYLRALITAARSYATFHYLAKTKHAAEGFDLNATTDQVYRGYGFELRAPNVAKAVEATSGLVMTHLAAATEQNPAGVALGAYSACTDGRTRNFTDVFGGDPAKTPYLVSVPDPDGICTNSRYLQGLDGNHMVGLSAVGARALADQGKTADEILAAYYTGIALTKLY